jgi:hypothetical protein
LLKSLAVQLLSEKENPLHFVHTVVGKTDTAENYTKPFLLRGGSSYRVSTSVRVSITYSNINTVFKQPKICVYFPPHRTRHLRPKKLFK